MSITVNGTARIAASSAGDTAAPVATDPMNQGAKAQSADAPKTGLGSAMQTPVPLRFPWLSRLASELEPVAKQKPPFPSLPVTGDNLDQAV